MNTSVVIAVVAVVAVAGIGGGVFFMMNNGGDEATTYSVTYDLDGGTGTAPVQKALKEGETFTVASCDANKTGKTFAGWSDGEKTCAAGSTYTVGTKNIVLKAIWNTASYSVTAPVSTIGYDVTAQNATVEYNQSYSFTVNVADKYNGEVSVTANGTHGTITTSKVGNTTTVTIPEIASDISSITLGGITELGIGTHFDYVISGTWATNTQNGTLEGSYAFRYVAQNSEDFVFTNINHLIMKQGETIVHETDNSDDPSFLYGNLSYANYCLNVSAMTPAGTAVVVTTDGQKTLNKYTNTNGTLTHTYFVDPSSNIMYKMTTTGTNEGTTLNIAYELGTYEILSEDPYAPTDKLTQRVVMSITGTHSTREISGTMTELYWAESPTQYITKTVWDLRYTDDSSAYMVGDEYELNDNDEEDDPYPPTGAVRGADVVMMTIDGEKTLQVWTYTENEIDYTVYLGMHGDEQIPYRMIQNAAGLSLQLTWELTEYVVIE